VSSSSTVNSLQKSRRRRRRKSKKNKPHNAIYVVALDCEMVGVGPDGLDSELARVVMIDWNGTVLLDVFCKPRRPVSDFRTYVSGIRAADLEQALDFCVVQSMVCNLLQDKILVGHALKNDLQALGIHHPWHMTRDTAKYEPFMKTRSDTRLWPRKLKELCLQFLHRDIQTPGQPHCPYQDAKAALDLYKTVRAKWEKVMVYKVQKTNQILQESMQQQAVAMAA
jgi:RNA exonuclease 4